MMNRRGLMLALPCMFLAPYAQAKSARKPKRIDVVKVVSFACPISRASEQIDGPLQDYLDSIGGTFVFSPFPAEVPSDAAPELSKPDMSSNRERVYYASRKQGMAVAKKVKESLFKGAQDMGLQLNNYLDVYTWLNQDIPEMSPFFADIFLHAQEEEAGKSIQKVAYLGHHAGSQSLPSYIVIVDGKIMPAMGPEDVQGGSLPKLREAVVASIKKHLEEE